MNIQTYKLDEEKMKIKMEQEIIKEIMPFSATWMNLEIII